MQQIDCQKTRIFNLLFDSNADFWTVKAIADELNLEYSQVENILKTNRQVFRTCLVPDISGQLLYTLRLKPIKWQEYWAFFRYTLMGSTK